MDKLSQKDWPRPNHKKHTDSFKTDNWILKIFENWYDPCPFNPGWNPYDNHDGLVIPWKDKTYVNPPYSNVLPWVEKAVQENQQGKMIVMLLKHDSSTRWYSLLHGAGARFILIQGRLKFNTGNACAFPSVLVVLD